MKFRSFVLALAIAVTLLFAIGIGGAVWLFEQSPLKLLQGGGVSSPAAAIFVPKQAPLMVSLLVNPDRLERLRLAIAPTTERRRARTELNRFRQNLLGDRGINYAEDIQPWLGDEITWAVTASDLDRDVANGLQPGYLLAVATRDPEQAKEFLQVFWQKRAIAGADLIFEQYAGVKVISGSIGAGEQGSRGASELEGELPLMALATAVVGDRFVLFANSAKVVREAINNVQATELSLSSSAPYQTALEQLPERQIGVVYANLPQLGRWLGQDEAPKPLISIQTNTTEATKDQRQFESLVSGLVLERQRLLAETALLPPAGSALKLTPAALTEPAGALQYLPAETAFLAAGTNLQKFWAEFSQGLAGYGTVAALVKQPLTQLERRWGMDFSQDLVSWVNREFALALLPNANTQQTDWIFVAEQTPETKPALENLDAIAQKRGLSIGPVMLGEQQAFAWTKLSTRETKRKAKSRNTPSTSATTLQANVEGVHTEIGNYEIFASSAEALDLALKTNSAGLANSTTFAQAIAPLQTTNDGYLYIDWPTVKPLLEKQVPLLKLVELSAKPVLDHVRSLTISSYGRQPELQPGAIFIRLQ